MGSSRGIIETHNSCDFSGKNAFEKVVRLSPLAFSEFVMLSVVTGFFFTFDIVNALRLTYNTNEKRIFHRNKYAIIRLF